LPLGILQLPATVTRCRMSNSAIAYVRDGDWQGAIDKLLGG
jgi:hypothetical protein